MANIWGDTEDDRRQSLGLLALLTGGNIMAANGPGVTTGQALGAGMAAGAHGMQQMQVNNLRRQQLAQQQAIQQAQIEQLQAKAAQEKMKSEAIQRLFPAGHPMADAAILDPASAIKAQMGFDKPSSLREWETFSAMTPEQQSQYLTMKRAQPWLNTGGAQVAPNMVNPAAPPSASIPNTLKPGEVPTVRGAQSAAEAIGKAQGTAQAGLPSAEMQARQMLDIVNGITSHPALTNVVGMPGNVSGFTARLIGTGLPGSPESDFMSRVDQLKGAAFLQAYETLKGGGQITEAEGRKATDAIARMSNLNLSVDDYKKAAQDLREVVNNALMKSKRSAGQTQAPSQSEADDLVKKYLGR